MVLCFAGMETINGEARISSAYVAAGGCICIWRFLEDLRRGTSSPAQLKIWAMATFEHKRTSKTMHVEIR